MGSSKSDLQSIAVNIFQPYLSFDIAEEMDWFRTKQNKRADNVSRNVDLNDWSVNPVLFRLIESRWGPHNRFASFYNAQILKYNATFENPGKEAVDAFIQDW